MDRNLLQRRLSLRPGRVVPFARAAVVLLLALAVGGCGAPTAPVSDGAGVRRLTLLHTNDHHGRAWAGEYRGCDGVGGLAAQATLVRGIRAEVEGRGGGALLVMAGDLNTGMPESDLFEARPDLEAMAMVGYDALVCGNHEFDGSAARWERQLEWATFPVLCANVRRRSDGSVAGRTHLSLTVAGLRVALVGVVTAEALSSGEPGLWTERYELVDPLETAAALAERLRGDHDLVIGLVHLGLYREGRHAQSGSLALARRTDAFDVIVDGHTHSLVAEPIRVGRTLIVQAGDHSAYVGRLDLEVRDGAISAHRYALLPLNAPEPGSDECPAPADGGGADVRIAEAADVATLLQGYRERVAEQLAEPVGVVVKSLAGGGHVARRGESALGNLVADALRWNTHADVAFVNGGGIRAPLGAGTATWGDLLRVCPFESNVVRMTLTGAELQAVLDRSARSDPDDGGFLQVSGMSFAIREGRAVDIRIGGTPLDPAATYVVATIDYLANGGDEYDMLEGVADTWNSGMSYAEALRRYVAHHGTVESAVEGRIRRDP